MSVAALRQYLRFPRVRSDPRLPDGQLLERYVATRDEHAFAALVERYGPLVFAVCQRVLRQAQDAEDAFQATFLVLARRAPSLDGRRPLANWLHAVAYRTSVKARQSAARRRAHQLQLLSLATVPAPEEKPWIELRPLLDEELNRLPEKYRAPLVLCFLEGKSHQQAARELGWPSGSMSRRMNRARELLRRRLARRGLTLSTGLLFLLIARNAGAATVSKTLAGLTTQAALAFRAGQAAISSQAASLAEEVLGTSALTGAAKGGSWMITLVLLAVIGTTSGILTHQVWTLLQQAGICGNAVKAPK
jgi:RNA polymerase sigma-70 factor (ECF subfamily)